MQCHTKSSAMCCHMGLSNAKSFLIVNMQPQSLIVVVMIVYTWKQGPRVHQWLQLIWGEFRAQLLNWTNDPMCIDVNAVLNHVDQSFLLRQVETHRCRVYEEITSQSQHHPSHWKGRHAYATRDHPQQNKGVNWYLPTLLSLLLVQSVFNPSNKSLPIWEIGLLSA